MSTNISLLTVKLLKIPGATDISANGINENGQVVGHFTDAKGVVHGFVYEDDSFCQIDYPGQTGIHMLGINNLGQMVGMFATDTATQGFFYDRGEFSPLTYPGAGNYTIATGVSDRGEITGVYQDTASKSHGFLYKAGQYRALDVPGATNTLPDDVDANGQVVGYYNNAAGTHGFIYLKNPGLFAPAVDFPKSKIAMLRGVNQGGLIVGGYLDAQSNEHPFLCIAGEYRPILIPGAVGATANDINDHGQIVGNYVDAKGNAFSFVAELLS